MSTLKNSVNDAIKRHLSTFWVHIATATGYVVEASAGIVAAVAGYVVEASAGIVAIVAIIQKKLRT